MLIACRDCHRQYDVSGLAVGDPIRCQCGTLNEITAPTPHEARAVHCSSCGGKLRPGASECTYCGNEIALADRHLGAACPGCFARLPQGAKFCLECGLAIRAERVQAMRVDAACPRCDGNLARCEFEAGHYTECTSCGGIWLEEEFFERLVNTQDTATLGNMSRESQASAAPRSPPGRQPDVRYLKCPVCSEHMHRKNFGKVSGVIIDWCKGCGFWFDAEELEKIVQFVKDGGLARTRQRELAEHKARMRSLEKRQQTYSQWQKYDPHSHPLDSRTPLRGSFEELTGCTVLEAVREFVGDLFGKVLTR